MDSDTWMLHVDVRKLLEESPIDDKGYVTIYEKKESHIERCFTILNPLSRRQCFVAVKRDHTFNQEIQQARFPVVRPSQGYSQEMRISPRFWRYFKKHGIDAVLADDETVLFEWQRRSSAARQSEAFE